MSHVPVVRTKYCIKCKQEKEISLFGRDASRPDGRYSYCKECRRRPNRQELIIEELRAKGLKRCSLCHKDKPFCAFEKDASKRLGVTSRCKKCKREQRRIKNAAWHAEREQMLDLYRQGLSKCYKCKEIKPFAQFLKSNTRSSGVFNLCLNCNNKIRQHYNRKRSKATRDYVRWEVFEDDEFTCYLCEEVLDPETLSPHPKSLTIDHVLPISRGGLDERDNVRTACLDCNRRKNDSLLEEFLINRDLLP